MNYYAARQRESDQRWDYTCLNDGKVWAVGFCRGYRSPEEIEKVIGVKLFNDEKIRLERNKDRFHKDGHATKEEAERCYYEYELTHTREFDEESAVKVCMADDCKEITHKGLHLDFFQQAWLCNKHRNIDEFRKVFPFRPGMTSISSY